METEPLETRQVAAPAELGGLRASHAIEYSKRGDPAVAAKDRADREALSHPR